VNSFLPQVNTVGERLLIFLYVSMDFVDLKSCVTSSSLLDFVFGLPSRIINKDDNFEGSLEKAKIFLTPKLPERNEGQFWGHT
jgi:hypothetical protein